MASPELTRAKVLEIVRSLSAEIYKIRGLVCHRDEDDEDGHPTFEWSCEVEMLDGSRLPASCPDHWPDGAEIHWA